MPRPHNEKGGPVSAPDCGFAGIVAVSLPVPVLHANTSDLGLSESTARLPSVRRFMLQLPEWRARRIP